MEERRGKLSIEAMLGVALKWFAIGIMSLILLAVLISLIWVGYAYDWTGFGDYIAPGGEFQRAKTFWDWLQLLVIPTVLALVALLFNHTQRNKDILIAEKRSQTEQAIATDRLRESALQDYFDKMAELLLEKGLRMSEIDAEVRHVARARTLSVLRSLDGKRKGILLQFLYEAELISQSAIINLDGADLRRVELIDANLRGASLYNVDLSESHILRGNLSGVNLNAADLSRIKCVYTDLSAADLSLARLPWSSMKGVDLSKANLNAADLREAYLSGTNLEESDLSEADLSDADLIGDSLNNTDLPPVYMRVPDPIDGTKWIELKQDIDDLPRAELKSLLQHKSELRKIGMAEAKLSGADLSGANMAGAKITLEQLSKAGSLEGAVMPDGQEYQANPSLNLSNTITTRVKERDSTISD